MRGHCVSRCLARSTGSFSSDEHFGTHLDAPAYFGGAWSTDKIPVERLVRSALSVEAAAFLVRERKVAGIGIDTPSVDYGPSAKYETYHTTMPENVYHIENAANLTGLPPPASRRSSLPSTSRGAAAGPGPLRASREIT